MKITPIFVDNNDFPQEGLFSIHYDGEQYNEFERLFELWNDIGYLKDFCIQNQSIILGEYFKLNRLEEFIFRISDEVYELEKMFYDFEAGGFLNDHDSLQSVFMPLNNNTYLVPKLQLQKSKIINNKLPSPVLRIYAVRISNNTFVITGGAIKITKYMADSEQTNRELEKMQVVKDFLQKSDIYTEDDLGYYYEKSE